MPDSNIYIRVQQSNSSTANSAGQAYYDESKAAQPELYAEGYWAGHDDAVANLEFNSNRRSAHKGIFPDYIAGYQDGYRAGKDGK